MVAEFKVRRDLLVDGLNAIPGITCKKPRGAFYVFPNVSALGKTSSELEGLLLDKYGVAALSGTAFGKHGEGYLRFSYANSQEMIKKALERVAQMAADLS
jgi:aspartate/methionine/tyrosine aminotransferase